MLKHYYLLDNVVDAPHGPTSIYKTSQQGQWTPDNYLYHFDDINTKLFYNIKRHDLLEKDSYKFVIEFVHMPISCNINCSQDTINLINSDDKTYLIVFSPLEYLVSKEKLFSELNSKNIKTEKVIVLSNDYELHNSVDTGVKFIYFDFWTSYSRYHYKLLPNVSVITPEERNQTVDSIDRKYICLNRNLKPHRVWFYYSLIKNEMINEGYVSYNLPSVANGFDYKNYATSSLVKKYIPRILHDDFTLHVQRKMLLKQLDKIDNKIIINHNTNLRDYYLKSAVSLVTETGHNKPVLSEKTFKAIMNMHPFCIIGDERNFSFLKARGYETFEDLFNVEIVNDYNTSVKLLENLKYNTLDKLKGKLKKRFIAKCEHNFYHFLNNKVSWNDVMENIFRLIGEV